MGESRNGIGAEGKMRIISNDYLTILCRFIVGGIFIYASFYKIIEPADFAKSIWYYHMVPGNMINLMALILPWVELIVGIGLVIGIEYRGSVLLANLMTVVFLIALGSAISRGLSIDCGCFKAAKAGTQSAWNSFYFDVGLLVLTLQLLLSKSTRWQICPKKTVTAQ
jgi:uncharacterized membrane protein YphA (DoxX/SURF4 family)